MFHGHCAEVGTGKPETRHHQRLQHGEGPDRLQSRDRNACMDRGERSEADRSEEHTSELQSLMISSYAVLCLKPNNTTNETKQLNIQLQPQYTTTTTR